MNISIITLFPQLYEPFLATSLVGRATQRGAISIRTRSLLEWCSPKERLDAPTFGHAPGMLIKPDVVERAVTAHEAEQGRSLRIFFSPHGKKLTQAVVKELYERMQAYDSVVMLPARYEGMDARVEEEYADEIVSIGDYVLMGGDIPAMVLLEAVLRYVPGVVGDKGSVEYDSFSTPFVDHPEYTSPVEWHGRRVPDVLRSGNHSAIQRWQHQEEARRTILHHFEWYRRRAVTAQDKARGRAHVPPHYCVLMHNDVVLPSGDIGTSSVTSIDIHDIGRSCATYGIERYFIVTRLVEQQKIVQTLLDFWQKGPGLTYNNNRHEAVARAVLRPELDDVITWIEHQHGVKPVVITTSSRVYEDRERMLTFYDQEKIWTQGRPVLMLLGTAHGLAPDVLNGCDYRLVPLEGMQEFNFLSVRSAAAVIFDRWLGLNREFV